MAGKVIRKILYRGITIFVEKNRAGKTVYVPNTDKRPRTKLSTAKTAIDKYMSAKKK